MLTEQRHELILKLLEEKKSITVTEVRDLLRTSESTVRRDITALDKAGKLTKVFGGAVANNYATFTPQEPTVDQKMDVNREEKRRIAKYAASLIEPGDFVYLDAGTTTAYMLDYLTDPGVTYVTNAVTHAKRLVKKGIKVILLGGELKASTEAVIGSQAVKILMNYHFTKGFFGTNGITKKTGFTTPDISEAAVKSMAMEQCRQCYVVADSSKFDKISSVSFSTLYGGIILTDRIAQGYEGQEYIIQVPEE
ncbi:MAG: DeoR/GlpR family DNA-binding transcription regulator [Eubacteriales bacterium]|nr:DeoR/GlpR family DNA-binding transcription regulator [Eubacteriales bacterium]